MLKEKKCHRVPMNDTISKEHKSSSLQPWATLRRSRSSKVRKGLDVIMPEDHGSCTLPQVNIASCNLRSPGICPTEGVSTLPF